MSNVNLAMAPARRLELHDHPAPPAGAEVHADGIWHEVQRGDGVQAIARDYSRAYHMDISASQLTSANAAKLSDGLQPGELLRIPGLAARFDTMILARNPHLSRVGDRLVHTVQSGDTLSKLAREYNEANGTRVTWQQIYAANKATIGADPSRIRPGQQLVIPGISTASAKATLQGLTELDTDQVLTRTARVRHFDGSVDTIDVVAFRADATHATSYSTASAALSAARTKLGSPSASGPLAVMQTRDGAYAVVPLRGTEQSDNLDDSDRTLSLAYRSDDRGVIAVVDRRRDTGAIETRRYDS
jgi:LysM repeat protein